MPIDFIDKTGQLRTDEEIQEAIDALKKEMIKNISPILNPLFIYYPTIIESLNELLAFRKTLRRELAKKQRDLSDYLEAEKGGA